MQYLLFFRTDLSAEKNQNRFFVFEARPVQLNASVFVNNTTIVIRMISQHMIARLMIR